MDSEYDDSDSECDDEEEEEKGEPIAECMFVVRHSMALFMERLRRDIS